jgi:hypothetical protein
MSKKQYTDADFDNMDECIVQAAKAMGFIECATPPGVFICTREQILSFTACVVDEALRQEKEGFKGDDHKAN